MKKAILITAILALVAGVGGGVWLKTRLDGVSAVGATQERKPSCGLYVDNVYQDDEMKRILLDQLGIHKNNIQGLELKFVENIGKDSPDTLLDPWGAYTSDSLGSFVGDNCITRPPRINVESHLSGVERTRVVAHEFVHHYHSRPWFSKTIPEQDLILLYTKSARMQARTSNYTHDGKLALTEVLAFACTEFPDSELSNNIIRTCNTILPKRHILGLNK